VDLLGYGLGVQYATDHTFHNRGCSMIGLVFSTPDEAEPFVEMVAGGRADGLEEGQVLETGEILVTVTGPGKIKATLATEQFLQRHDPDTVIHAGAAAALTNDLSPGTLAAATFVLEGDRVALDTPTYPRMPLEPPFTLSTEGTLVTQDHTNDDSEEQSYWERIADMRDNTGYAVAYVAAQHGTTCHVLKGIMGPVGSTPDPDVRRETYETVATALETHLEPTATDSPS